MHLLFTVCTVIVLFDECLGDITEISYDDIACMAQCGKTIGIDLQKINLDGFCRYNPFMENCIKTRCSNLMKLACGMDQECSKSDPPNTTSCEFVIRNKKCLYYDIELIPYSESKFQQLLKRHHPRYVKSGTDECRSIIDATNRFRDGGLSEDEFRQLMLSE